jgi:LysR family transcriptional regulator, regulator for metE and metH
MKVASETRHLQLLVALDEEGSLHGAARRLHLTPSALSQQLRELEQRLGGALFHRQWRRLVATAAGRRITDGAKGILGELDRVEQEARALLTGAQSTLRIAMACQESYRWLPDVLSRYAAREPSVEVSIVSEGAAAPREWLVSRKLDLALMAGKLAHDRHLKTRRLFRDELVAVVSRRHPWAGERQVPPRAFGSEQLFSDEDALKKDAPLGRVLAEAHTRPRKISIVPMNGTVALDLVRANLGVTVMPRWTVAELASRGDLALVRIGGRGLWLEWSAIVRNEPSEPALATFLAVVEESVRGTSLGASPSRAKRRSTRAT